MLTRACAVCRLPITSLVDSCQGCHAACHSACLVLHEGRWLCAEWCGGGGQ